jgi:glycosyltransferase involved in cell wall biosynthesis
VKILYFSFDYVTHDHRFLKAISEGGHEVHYLRLQRSARQVEDRPVPPMVHQVLWAGGQGPFRWRDLPRLVKDFKRVVREIKPDLVHAGPIQTCAFIAALARFHPLFTMSWGFDLMEDAERNWRMKRITKYVLRNTDYFTSDAMITRDKAVAYGMRPDKTVVFPWGVDLQHFKPSPGRRLAAASQQPPIVLFCNRSWETRYGVDVLAKAFVKVAGQRPEVSLILLGGGSQGGAIRQTLQNGGALERVTFGGQISQTDLPRWYHMADIYISPSHIDGSSVSLMEALACGLPCLVSDIPANREWIEEEKNGWLFRDGDANHLAEKILAAIAQREKWPEMGRANRRSAQERADWKKNSAQLLKAYELAVKS